MSSPANKFRRRVTSALMASRFGSVVIGGNCQTKVRFQNDVEAVPRTSRALRKSIFAATPFS